METIEGYYADLRRAIESLPVQNILVILGDFNAKLGSSDVAYSYHEKKQERYISIRIAQEKELVIANTGSRNKGESNGHVWIPGKQTSTELYPSQQEVEEQHNEL